MTERYEKIKDIGRGGYGSAMLARSLVNQKLYVIKKIGLAKNQATDEKRWVDEIKILQACKHVNVVRYKECFFSTDLEQLNNLHCTNFFINIVMEYADAGDLHACIKRQKNEVKSLFPESQVRNWLVQLALSLQYLHKMRVMHRDIKSANVFMTSSKLLKLGDFGVSKVLSPGSDFASTCIGTPHNVCPEIVNSQPYDFKSDIWSLGCVVYEVCSLKLPFYSNNLPESFAKIRDGVYAPIPTAYSEILRDLIRIMLKVDPKRRPTAYQLLTSQALKEDLEIYMDHVKKLPQSASISSDSGEFGATTRSSCSSRGSGGDASSSGVFSLQESSNNSAA